MGTLASKKNSNPRTPCTVLLPVRNGEEFISKSLENLLQITGEQDQILVMNDGSTDSTTSILKQYQEKYDRLYVITIPQSGLVIALNTGLENALNEFVARADVDDLYREDRLDIQVELLEANPRIGAVFSDYKFWNSEMIIWVCCLQQSFPPQLNYQLSVLSVHHIPQLCFVRAQFSRAAVI